MDTLAVTCICIDTIAISSTLWLSCYTYNRLLITTYIQIYALNLIVLFMFQAETYSYTKLNLCILAIVKKLASELSLNTSFMAIYVIDWIIALYTLTSYISITIDELTACV